MQTRKWTGNDGQERYSTEVVLNRFRGELTMLDSRGGGGAPERDEDRDAVPAAVPAGNGGGGTDAARQGADLDDEIPF